jgi:hypothetical protein
VLSSFSSLAVVVFVKMLDHSIRMPRAIIAVPVRREFKVELESEAWVERLTLAAYVRLLLERSKTPDGRARVAAKMRRRGRPKRS